MTVRRALLAFAVAVLAGALIGASGGKDDNAYRVRAVFDNASFLIPGEDVKVSGVKVGVIDAVELTDSLKAAVVLKINDPAFRPFRSDASCHVALQSLIGEQFVECIPTQPRGPGVKPAPPLRIVRSGDGKGQAYLPVTQTVTPINQDLIQNIMRVPQRERFRLVINELGAGLAGNGTELSAALRRAAPALQQTDKVITVLANQNQLLARLVDDSSKAIKPLAQRRKQLGNFIAQSARTAEAAASQGDALEADFRKFPPFLEKLGPAADDFGTLADEVAPTLDVLNARAAQINQTVELLGPTAKKATPALIALGDTAEKATRTFPALEPATRKLDNVARPLLPVSMNLADLSSSFDKAGGIENAMRFIYYYTASVNGEDELGHYIRGALQVNICSGRSSLLSPGCESNFAKTSGAQMTSVAGSQSQLLDYLLGGGR